MPHLSRDMAHLVGGRRVDEAGVTERTDIQQRVRHSSKPDHVRRPERNQCGWSVPAGAGRPLSYAQQRQMEARI